MKTVAMYGQLKNVIKRIRDNVKIIIGLMEQKVMSKFIFLYFLKMCFSKIRIFISSFALIDEKRFEKISSSQTDLINLISLNYTNNAFATNVYKIQVIFEIFKFNVLTSKSLD